MRDRMKVGNYIMDRRKALGFTQQQKNTIKTLVKDISETRKKNKRSCARLLIDKMPQIKQDKIDGVTFVEQIMKRHKSIKGLFDKNIIHGMAHITGGGIKGNLCRVIPDGLSAKIDLSQIRTLNIFECIRNNGNISDEEMFRTFNCGVGFTIVTT